MKTSKGVRLHTAILSIFGVLIAIITGIGTLHNYRGIKELAVNAAETHLVDVSSKIFERTRELFLRPIMLADLVTSIPDISKKPFHDNHPLAPMLIKILSANPTMASVYIAFEDGNLFRVYNLSTLEMSASAFAAAPAGAAYAILVLTATGNQKRTAHLSYLGEDLKVLSDRHDAGKGLANSDPRLENWYQQASVVSNTIITDPYAFTQHGEFGLSVAKSFTGSRFGNSIQGVFGIDILLSNISRFLSEQTFSKSSISFIFTSGGELIAYPDHEKVIKIVSEKQHSRFEKAALSDLANPVIDELYRLFSAADDKSSLGVLFEVEGESYLARVTAIPAVIGDNKYIASIVPVREFSQPFIAAGRDSLLISLLVLLIVVPVVIVISIRISRPLSRLVIEADSIREFDLSRPINVSSRISEIRELSEAMASMKTSIGAFGKYLPKYLVQNIVNSGIVPELGGERRKLTIFFSDIEDFTPLSENLKPEELMLQVSEYFDNQAAAIKFHSGTIDKYIGDSIMAFWNAPVTDDNHITNACIAALHCITLSNELNEKWKVDGRDIMRTRIGLHTGDSIVGNVGSSDRMNYTAMGASVNLAARLEGLNKVYGTQILVSASIVDAVNDHFLFRSVGRVMPKGINSPVDIFELVSIREKYVAEYPYLPSCKNSEDYCRTWEKTYTLFIDKKWAQALTGFKSLQTQRMEDPLLNYFMKKVQNYLENDPGHSWSFITEFNSK